jgi:L-asparaginase II
MSVKLVEVTRGDMVESIHRGDIVVVDNEGNLLYKLGDANHLCYMRSASKPIQVIAALEAGIVEKYGLSLAEIALSMSSHSGEKIHIDTLNSMMQKTAISIEAVRCGIHEPLGNEAARKLVADGLMPNSLHCTCSGKHLAQLAAVKAKGLSIDDYDKLGGGIQPEILNIISAFSGVKVSRIRLGIDGCGIPVYGIPLKKMAFAYANLCSNTFMNGKYSRSQEYVLKAMATHPEMIGGKGRFDTEMLRHFGDRLIGKFGDEGVYCVGLVGKGTGVALKIEDGHTRAVGPVILETLRQIGVISDEELKPMKDSWKPSIKNHRGEIVGEIKPVFKLEKQKRHLLL